MDCDTDAAFVGDAAIDRKRMQSDKRTQKSSRDGEETLIAARGGIVGDLLDERATEHDPLLAHAGASSTGHESGDGNGNSADEDYPGKDDFNHLPWWRRPSILWLLGPFFVMTLAFGGIITPRINLLLNLICQEYYSEQGSLDPNFTVLPIVFGQDNAQCRIPEVQSRVANFTLYGNLIAGLLSAVSSPRLGAISDRYGRIRVLTLTSVGTICGDVVLIVAANKPDTFNVNWILLGFALDGLCGSFTSAMALSNAYATDCTPPSRRNISFGYFHGCLFTGIALGPILAGLLVKSTGSTLTVFYVSLGVHACFILFLALVVPESLSQKRQLAAREKYRWLKESASTSWDWVDQLRRVNVLAPLKVLWPRGEGATATLRRNLVFLAAVDTILFGVAMGSMTVVIIYTNYQFGWGSYESGAFLSIVNTCRVVNLIIVLPLVTKWVRGKATKQPSSGCDNFDLYVIRIAVLFDTIGYLGYTLARTGPLVVLSGAVASIGGMGSPTLQAALTKHVPPERTGQLLGASGQLHALARVVAPTIFNAIYAATVGKFTQTVFVCLTATFGAAFFLSWFIKPHIYLTYPSTPRRETADDVFRERENERDNEIVG